MLKYLVLVTLVNADEERWGPGAYIELDDAVAQIHLTLGNIAALPVIDVVVPAVQEVIESSPIEAVITNLVEENHDGSISDGETNH